jgi:hypothetical protein
MAAQQMQQQLAGAAGQQVAGAVGQEAAAAIQEQGLGNLLQGLDPQAAQALQESFGTQ